MSWAVDRLFVGLVATAALQASAYAQSTTAAGNPPSAQSASSTDGASNTTAQSTALPAVEIKATAEPGDLPAPYAGGQVARGGSIGVLGTANLMNTPFSTTNYTEEMIEDTQAYMDTARFAKLILM